MSIQKKLEEIQQQPEHIRMRYVFLCVFVSMILVGILWIVSLGKNFENIARDTTIQNAVKSVPLESAVQEIQKQQDVIQKGMEQVGTAPTGDSVTNSLGTEPLVGRQ